MSEKIEIPEKYQEFCREVAALASRLGVEKAQVKLQPAFDDEWSGEISASCEMERHGSSAHRICIRSEIRVHTDLSGDPKGFHR
ncbi:MAG: hypothetical protein V7731_13420 [Amphritea sp.]